MNEFQASPATPRKKEENRKRSYKGLSLFTNFGDGSESPRADRSGRGSFSPTKANFDYGENNLSRSPSRVRVFSPKSADYSKVKDVSSLCSPDRFIANRASLNLDYCHHELTTKGNINDENSHQHTSSSKKAQKTPMQLKFDEEIYSLSGASPGRRLLSVFEGSPAKEPDASTAQDDVLPRSFGDSTTFTTNRSGGGRAGPMRSLPSGPSRILDAPDLVDDYYLNLLSWGSNNIIAVALQKSVYLWHAADGSIDQLCSLDENDEDYVTSVEWSRCPLSSNVLAVGTALSGIELWDVEHMRKIQSLQGHTARVSSLAWNGATLTSGSRDSSILNHDTRQSGTSNRVGPARFMGHQQEVCGLSWSPDGRILASGGNENLLCLWDPTATQTHNAVDVGGVSSSFLDPLYCFDQHQAAVKALAWCPFQRHTLASGGGTADRTIRLWNVANGSNIKTVDSGSQVCALQWNETHKELLSSHGFSDNQLCLWKYPSMAKIKEFRGHSSRVLHMAKSPDGSTVVSAGADETLRFWEIFGNPSHAPNKSSFQSGSSLRGTLGQGMLNLR